MWEQGGPPDPFHIRPTTSRGQSPQKNDVTKNDDVTVEIAEPKKLDFEQYMVTSCVIMWCCNIVFGGIAYLVARKGKKSASYDKARHLLKVSCGLNIAGMLITWIILAVILALYFTNNLNNLLPYYRT